MNYKVYIKHFQIISYSMGMLITTVCFSANVQAEQVCASLTATMSSDITSADNTYKTFEECKAKLADDIQLADERAISSLKRNPSIELKEIKSACENIGGKLSDKPERIDFAYIQQRRLCDHSGGDTNGWFYKTSSWAAAAGIYQCCYEQQTPCL